MRSEVGSQCRRTCQGHAFSQVKGDDVEGGIRSHCCALAIEATAVHVSNEPYRLPKLVGSGEESLGGWLGKPIANDSRQIGLASRMEFADAQESGHVRVLCGVFSPRRMMWQ